MNNFINTINVEGVDYDIQTSVNLPLAYLGNNSLRLNIGTGLDIYDGDLIADITHNFHQFNSIIIDPEYWSIDNQGRLLPSSSVLLIGTDKDSLKSINTLLIGTGLELSDNIINVTVPISTDAGSNIYYASSLNIGQGLKYDNGELSVDSIYTEGGILIATDSFEGAERVTGIKITDDFSFDTITRILSLNYDHNTLTMGDNGLQLSTMAIKGIGYLPNDNTLSIRTINPLYINSDGQVSINIGSGLHVDISDLSITYDATYFTINDIGELTLNDTVKEKLGLL